MAQLAIQGHSTRGNEVIALLEILGGKNPYGCNGLGTLCAYHIIDGNIQVVTIEDLFKSNKYILYSLEGILARFPYKVGDKVIYEDKIREIAKMVWEEQTNTVAYKFDDKLYCNVINELQPYKEETMENNINYCQLGKITAVCFQDTNYEDKVELQLGNDYEIKEENGKYYAVKKQSKYPKTYAECCKIMNIHSSYELFGQGEINNCVYAQNLLKKINKFQQLLICRDAYWKIAGEQMGLGKSWEPDYNEESYEQGSPIKYVIYYTGIYITKERKCTPSYILAFPTEEMRNAFYENFKELIEICKELL